MATLFDILNAINNNNNTVCKRQSSVNNKSSNNNNSNNNTIKRIEIVPDMDVTMTHDKLIIETELPGVNKNDIKIEIKDSTLIIQGEKKKSVYIQKQQQSAVADQQLHVQDKPTIEEFKDDDSDVKDKSTITNNKPKENYTAATPKKFITERSFGHFKLNLDLTKVLYQLDLNTINTQFENGLLTISINTKVDHSNSIKILIN